MPYADQSDLLQRMTADDLAQLTGGASKVVNVGVVQGALESASALVDSYCRARYQTPLEPSDTVTEIAADIAVYKLFLRSPVPVREGVRQRYEDALAVLKDIATGKAALDQPLGAPAAQTVLGGAALPDANPLRFTDCDLQGFV